MTGYKTLNVVAMHDYRLFPSPSMQSLSTVSNGFISDYGCMYLSLGSLIIRVACWEVHAC